jgi:hypothetical protein
MLQDNEIVKVNCKLLPLSFDFETIRREELSSGVRKIVLVIERQDNEIVWADSYTDR